MCYGDVWCYGKTLIYKRPNAQIMQVWCWSVRRDVVVITCDDVLLGCVVDVMMEVEL
jgi:hypothetical protein